MSRFAVLVSVGPSSGEMDRLKNLLESLFAHEPLTSWVVLINDSNSRRPLDTVIRFPRTCTSTVLPNPRRGRGHGWSGGLCVGVLAGLSWIQQNTDARFALKIDTDALVIAPFKDKIVGHLDASPNVGVTGSYRFYPAGQVRRNAEWVPSIKTFLSPIKLRGRYLQVTLWGRPRKRREALQEALANGYEFAEHCQGGAYAASGELLLRMAARGYFDDPLAWLRSGITEDLMMGIMTKAVGMEMSDLNRDHEPFGVQFCGLAYDPEEMIARGYSIIHSVKGDKNYSETYILNLFSSRRRSASARATSSPTTPRATHPGLPLRVPASLPPRQPSHPSHL